MVRKELITSAKTALAAIGKFELIDLQKGQFSDPEGNFGTIYTAALIEVGNIKWETTTGNNKEGEASLKIYLYTKEGFAGQHQGTTSPQDGLQEIELIEQVVEKIEKARGKGLKPFLLESEGAITPPGFGMMAYQLDFHTYVYYQNQRYKNQKITKKLSVISSQ